MSAYRFNSPTTVMIQDGIRQRFAELPVGSVFFTTDSEPDRNGMFDGTCEGSEVYVFARDLMEGAEPMATDPRVASLRSQIDAALTFVCLAEHDIRAGGDKTQTAELLEQAILAHKAVVNDLGSLSEGLEQEKIELGQGAETLLRAIRSVKGEFQVLLGQDQLHRHT